MVRRWLHGNECLGEMLLHSREMEDSVRLDDVDMSDDGFVSGVRFPLYLLSFLSSSLHPEARGGTRTETFSTSLTFLYAGSLTGALRFSLAPLPFLSAFHIFGAHLHYGGLNSHGLPGVLDHGRGRQGRILPGS